MKKVLIVSDSHGLRDEVEEIKRRHQLTHMIHCGDSELSAEDPVLADMIAVKGNCDVGPKFVNDKKVNIEGVSFFLTHGHLYDVKNSLLALSYRAQEEEVEIVCFGHSHIAGAERIGDQLFINPGSIKFPRQRSEKSYAIVSFESGSKVNVDFYTVEGNLIIDLGYNDHTH